jgi:hypothetical protein
VLFFPRHIYNTGNGKMAFLFDDVNAGPAMAAAAN